MTIDRAKLPPMWRVAKDGVFWDAWPSEGLGWPRLRVEGNSEADAIAKAHAAMETIVAPYVAAELRRLAREIDTDDSWIADNIRERADELDPPATPPISTARIIGAMDTSGTPTIVQEFETPVDLPEGSMIVAHDMLRGVRVRLPDGTERYLPFRVKTPSR